jgi:hypothetical protein
MPRRWFRIFRRGSGRLDSRLHGSHRPRRTTVQPVQLSLGLDQVPAPPVALLGRLPEPQVQAAIVMLAGLIVKASAEMQAADE